MSQKYGGNYGKHGKGGRGQFRGLDARARRKRQTNKQDLPLAIGETSIRKNEGTRRWSWIKKTRKGNPGFRKPSDPVKAKSVRYRWDQSWLLDWPEFKFTRFTPYRFKLDFDWSDFLRWPSGYPWGFQWWMWRWFGVRWKEWAESGVEFPSWEFPNGVTVFQVPIGLPPLELPNQADLPEGFDLEEVPSGKLATVCGQSSLATVTIQCQGGQVNTFTTENTPVYVSITDVWKRYHHVRVFRRQFYNYGKARGEVEAAGPIKEFVEFTYYAGEIKWEKTVDYAWQLGGKPGFGPFYKQEPVPKGWSCFTRPVMGAGSGFIVQRYRITQYGGEIISFDDDFEINAECEVVVVALKDQDENIKIIIRPVSTTITPIGTFSEIISDLFNLPIPAAFSSSQLDSIETDPMTFLEGEGITSIGPLDFDFGFVDLATTTFLSLDTHEVEALFPVVRTSSGYEKTFDLISDDLFFLYPYPGPVGIYNSIWAFSGKNTYETEQEYGFLFQATKYMAGSSFTYLPKRVRITGDYLGGTVEKILRLDSVLLSSQVITVDGSGSPTGSEEYTAISGDIGTIVEPAELSPFSFGRGEEWADEVQSNYSSGTYVAASPSFFSEPLGGGGGGDGPITPETIVSSAEVVVVDPNGTETVVYTEDAEEGESIWLDCKMVASPDELDQRNHLYACRTEAFETADKANMDVRLLGSHTCYAPDTKQNAIRPGSTSTTRQEMKCWEEPPGDAIERQVRAFRESVDRANREAAETSRPDPARDANYNLLKQVLPPTSEEDFAKLVDRFDAEYLRNPLKVLTPGKTEGITPPPQTEFDTSDHPLAPDAPIPLNQKDFPYSYRCTCPDFSDMAANEKGNGELRTWDRADIPVLANGQRACKHVLKVMTMKGEIDERDIPNDLPVDVESE